MNMIIINAVLVIGMLSLLAVFVGINIVVGNFKLTLTIVINEAYGFLNPKVKEQAARKMFNNRAKELKEMNFSTFKKRLEDANGAKVISQYHDSELKKIKKTWINNNEKNAENVHDILKQAGLLNPIISLASSVRAFSTPNYQKKFIQAVNKNKRQKMKRISDVRLQGQSSRFRNDNYGSLNFTEFKPA
ncbi:hypothetical protein QYM39_05930 [Pediococcus pentosaceus]|uniref:hypothetical protein n=1 Tax=Pediococcus pentosaceus TaxID=1255 RepID=UPI002658DE08|nr:hypothetical protein [Pediococcus pentosaceus]WKF70446.1 hypothetical protein QYM39_05930 [Pediococcus pentosaceus]